MDERCPHAERPAPFRWEGGRSRGTAGREPLAPAPRLRTRSAAASQGGATGLGTGQRIPGRRACCPVVTPGPRSAGVNDRRRRRATGAARSAGGPSHPSAVTTSPYRLATPRGPAIGRAAPPPTSPRLRIGCRPGIARPAPHPFPLCAAGARGRCAIPPRLDWRPPSLRLSRRATVPERRGRTPHSVPTRGEVGKGHKVRAHWGSALPRPRPGQAKAGHALSA